MPVIMARNFRHAVSRGNMETQHGRVTSMRKAAQTLSATQRLLSGTSRASRNSVYSFSPLRNEVQLKPKFQA